MKFPIIYINSMDQLGTKCVIHRTILSPLFQEHGTSLAERLALQVNPFSSNEEDPAYRGYHGLRVPKDLQRKEVRIRSWG